MPGCLTPPWSHSPASESVASVTNVSFPFLGACTPDSDQLGVCYSLLLIPKSGCHTSRAPAPPFLSGLARGHQALHCKWLPDHLSHCEAARANSMTGGQDLSFGFPWNGKIPYPHQATWSQPSNMRPVRNKGKAEKPTNAQVWKKHTKACTNKIALQTCNQSA